MRHPLVTPRAAFLVLSVSLFLVAAARADGPRPATISVNWRLVTAAVQNGLDNGFALTCQKAALISFEITVKGSDGKSSSTVKVACPAAEDNGYVDLALPRGAGPFTVSAKAAGKRALRSEQVRRVVAGDAVTLRIYVHGCDAICD